MPLAHGTLRGYSHYGCRCEECKDTWNERKRRYNKRPEQLAKAAARQKAYHDRRAAIDPAYVERVKAAKRASNERMLKDPVRRAIAFERSRRLQNARRAEIAKLKVARGCADCGYNTHPAALEFDHVRGQKLGNVAALANYGWAVVLKEIEKCEVVCANCHRIRTEIRKEAARAAERPKGE